jgi:uncharacterized protein
MVIMAKKTKLPSIKKNTTSSTAHFDDWANILTGIGVNNSRVKATKYHKTPLLDRDTLTNIYLSNGIGARIVRILVDDALRKFVHCEDELLKEFNRLEVKQKIIDAATWARLYGGGALIVFADDGQEMDKPLRINSIKKIVKIEACDRHQIEWIPTDFVTNYYDKNFGTPEIYTINMANGVPFRVHRSRMHLFNGVRVPHQVYISNNRWDVSVLQSCYEAMRNYGQSMNAASEIVQDFIQVILGINGLTDMIRTGNDDLVTKRATVIDLTRSISNTIFLDSEQESYQKQASSIAGLSDLLDRFAEHISAETGIPLTKLLGRSPAGLNSTGKSDMDNWDNIVDAYRGDELAPAINWLVDLLSAQVMWDSSQRPSNYNWEFPSLKISNENEISKNRLIAAQIDQIYIDRGAVDPQFIFKKRYANGSFETDIFIENNELDGNTSTASYQDINDVKIQMTKDIKEEKALEERKDKQDKQEAIDLLAYDLCNKLMEKL